jgi:hypothetical protein
VYGETVENHWPRLNRVPVVEDTEVLPYKLCSDIDDDTSIASNDMKGFKLGDDFKLYPCNYAQIDVDRFDGMIATAVLPYLCGVTVTLNTSNQSSNFSFLSNLATNHYSDTYWLCIALSNALIAIPMLNEVEEGNGYYVKQQLVEELNLLGIHCFMSNNKHQFTVMKHCVFTNTLVALLLKLDIDLVRFIGFGHKANYQELLTTFQTYHPTNALFTCVDGHYWPEFDFGYYLDMEDLPLFFSTQLFEPSRDLQVYPLFCIMDYPDIVEGDLGTFTYTHRRDNGDVVYKVTVYHNLKHFLINYSSIKWFVGKTVETCKYKVRALKTLLSRLQNVEWKWMCKLRVEISINGKSLEHARHRMMKYGLDDFKSIVTRAFGVDNFSECMITLSKSMYFEGIEKCLAHATSVMIGRNDDPASSFQKLVLGDLMSMFGYYAATNRKRFMSNATDRKRADSYFKEAQFNSFDGTGIQNDVDRTVGLSVEDKDVRADIADNYLRTVHRNNKMPNFRTKKGGQGKSFLTEDEVVQFIFETFGADWRKFVVARI